jgi:hypothetical protein
LLAIAEELDAQGELSGEQCVEVFKRFPPPINKEEVTHAAA